MEFEQSPEFAEFLKSLPEKDRKKLIATILAIQSYGIQTAIKMQWVKKLESNLYEIRSKLGSNIQRAIYFQVKNEHYYITHGFKKKLRKHQ